MPVAFLLCAIGELACASPPPVALCTGCPALFHSLFNRISNVTGGDTAWSRQRKRAGRWSTDPRAAPQTGRSLPHDSRNGSGTAGRTAVEPPPRFIGATAMPGHCAAADRSVQVRGGSCGYLWITRRPSTQRPRFSRRRWPSACCRGPYLPMQNVITYRNTLNSKLYLFFEHICGPKGGPFIRELRSPAS